MLEKENIFSLINDFKNDLKNYLNTFKSEENKEKNKDQIDTNTIMELLNKFISFLWDLTKEKIKMP